MPKLPYFRNIEFPATPAELYVIAFDEGAPPQMLDRILQLPDRVFESRDEAIGALGGA